MATYHGKNGVVKVATNTVLEVNQFSHTETAAIADDSAMGDAWDTHLVGRNGATGSITCHWDPGDTTGQVALAVGASVALKLYPSGAGTGDEEISLTATVTSVGVQSEKDGVVSQSFDYTANGAVVHAAVGP
tara:strand:- start:18719 stop:19114 length:396 start_codon:yes stop_codon:yes gene_type:complete